MGHVVLSGTSRPVGLFGQCALSEACEASLTPLRLYKRSVSLHAWWQAPRVLPGGRFIPGDPTECLRCSGACGVPIPRCPGNAVCAPSGVRQDVLRQNLKRRKGGTGIGRAVLATAVKSSLAVGRIQLLPKGPPFQRDLACKGGIAVLRGWRFPLYIRAQNSNSVISTGSTRNNEQSYKRFFRAVTRHLPPAQSYPTARCGGSDCRRIYTSVVGH